MTARCIKCNLYVAFGARGDKLKEMRCRCGGTYEKMIWHYTSVYRNKKGEFFQLEKGTIEFKPLPDYN